jgi:hypothetical protein
MVGFGASAQFGGWQTFYAASIGVAGSCLHDGVMSNPAFVHLNPDWNAEPNDPDERVSVRGATLQLTFALNSFAFDTGGQARGSLVFEQCSMWRLGSTNDEGWHAGQCRYGKKAPVWGEFYELLGDDDQRFRPTDWHEVTSTPREQRHFLFYFRDNTFECFAADWRFVPGGPS